MKEREELTPENRQPATGESKEEFLNNVDCLTERGYVGEQGSRLKEYDLKDGRKIELFYNSAEGMRGVEEFTDDPTKAQMNLLEPMNGNDNNLKMTTCYLKRSGAVEQHISLRDLNKDRERHMKSLEKLEGGGDDFREEIMKFLEEIKHIKKSMEQATQLGLAFVSEADLRSMNEILRALIAEQENQKK